MCWQGEGKVNNSNSISNGNDNGNGNGNNNSNPASRMNYSDPFDIKQGTHECVDSPLKLI